MNPSIDILPEVNDALRNGHPVVALESAVLTTGLPATPLRRAPQCAAPGWDGDRPTNLEVALLLERVVRDVGAVPATIAVVGGVLRIGLDEAALRRLLTDGAGIKTATEGLAVAMRGGRAAGTTVSATVLACTRADAGRIHVAATGGIGGVHKGWTRHPDISNDLRQLATTPVCVVSCGVKSVLDAPATLELLETLGVPVIAFGTDRFPRFYSRAGDELPARHRLDDAGAVAEVCRTHWGALGCSGGVLVANPAPAGFELDSAEIDRAAGLADQDARRRGITGPQRTPHVLEAVALATGGRALEANIALLSGNARLAAEVARAFSTGAEDRSM